MLACVSYVGAQLTAALELSSSGSFLLHRQQVVCRLATQAMNAAAGPIQAVEAGLIWDPCLPLTVVRTARAAVEAAAELEFAHAQLRWLQSFQTAPAPPAPVQPAAVQPTDAGISNPAAEAAAEPAAAEPAAAEPAGAEPAAAEPEAVAAPAEPAAVAAPAEPAAVAAPPAAPAAGPDQFPNPDSLQWLGWLLSDPEANDPPAGEAAPAASGRLPDAAQPAAADPERAAQPEQQAARSAGTGDHAVSNAAVLQAMQSSEEGSDTSGRESNSGAAGAQLVRALLAELPPDQSAEEGLQAVSQALSRSAALLAVGSTEGVEPATRQDGPSGGWAQRAKGGARVVCQGGQLEAWVGHGAGGWWELRIFTCISL